MSRLSTLSPAALRAMFSTESNDILITLITLRQNTAYGLGSDVRLCDNYTKRISETATDVVYGVTSNGLDYVFLPIEVTLPNEDSVAAPRISLTIHDVTQYLVPLVRNMTGAITVDLAMVLASTPNTVEISHSNFKMTNISYNANSLTAELTVPSLEIEPFPAHSFTPQYFPGLF